MSTRIETPTRRAIEFFERQFRRQSEAGDYALNPFERVILPHLRGDVLDLGCGLGNLALAAAGAGCRVVALDASPVAIADLARRAGEQGLPVEAHTADLRHYVPGRLYDCAVSVGLLMFFDCPAARALLGRLRDGVRPGGLAAVNVLIEGTTYLDMFDPAGYCLFARDELTLAFAGWNVLVSRYEDFEAPGGTSKRFHTLVARRPEACGGDTPI
jgi:tellurite methyltransferase